MAELVLVRELTAAAAGIPAIEAYRMPTVSQLPTNTATWRPEQARTVLLIHDMQRYFLAKFVPHCPPVTELIANVTALHRRCRTLGIPVCYTAQPGSMTPLQRGLLRDFWGPGMSVADHDRAVIDPIAPSADDWVITKWRYSAFHHSDLQTRMATAGRDQLLVCGVYAHVGILATAIDAFSNDIEVFLAADGVADFNADYHALALRYAAQRCAVVATTAQLLDALPTSMPAGASASEGH